MATRTTPSEVQKIFTLSSDYDVSNIVPFITQASIFVDTYLSGSGLGDDVLRVIEMNITAHMLCSLDQRVEQEKMGDAQVKYSAPKVGMGLKGTRYGQMAIMMDPTGTLAKVAEGGRKKASLGMIDYNTDTDDSS